MAGAFTKGAEENGHVVTVVNVCQKKISGACGYCHREGSGHERQCAQQDDMQAVCPVPDHAPMEVTGFLSAIPNGQPVREGSSLRTGR